jgi:hypothetical protein
MNRSIIACAVACAIASAGAVGLGGIPTAVHAQPGTPMCVTNYMMAHGNDLAAARKACGLPTLLALHPNPGEAACVVAYQAAHGGPGAVGAAIKACGITPGANRNITFTNHSGAILSIEVKDGPADAQQTLYANQKTLITAPADHDVGIEVGNYLPGEPPLVLYYPAGSGDISFVMNADGIHAVFSEGGSANSP